MDIQITVADVIYPAAGKKQGKIIDHTGKEWQVWGDKMANYSRGSSYVVQKYKTSDFKGRTYYTIEEATPVGQGPGMVRPPAIPSTPVRMAPVQPNLSENERRLDIFVCGAFNNLMSNPNVNPTLLSAADMISLMSRLKDTWVNTLGPNRPGTAKRAQDNSDINDELPEGF